MKVTAFSDTHGLHSVVKLPPSDLFIFAGDAMTCGYKEHEILHFLKWYHSQDARHKIMIAGNHDRFIENHRGLFLEMVGDYPSITYLENSGIVLDNGLYVWGTPDTKEFMNWAFNRTDEQLEKVFSAIPFDVNILVSHGPQFGVLDMLERGERVGEAMLSNQMKRFTNLQYHIFGHVHCGYGEHKGEHTSLNVSVVNEAYQIQNNPIQFTTKYPHG